MNGPSKNARLAKIKPNSRGLVVSYFCGGPSRSLDFFFNAKEVSGSQKMYQSRRLAKSRIYHSTPLKVVAPKLLLLESSSKSDENGNDFKTKHNIKIALNVRFTFYERFATVLCKNK